MRLARTIAGSSGFLIALVVAAWLGIEAGGKGTGVVKWLFTPTLTRDQGFHPVDVVAARPKGPVRLTPAEAEATHARLAKAFGGNLPRHERTSAMTPYYELKAEARCPHDRSDLVECNKIQRMEVFFAEVLGAMHSATEHLFWLERASNERGRGRGQPVRVAVFAGTDGEVKFAFDLRAIKRSADLQSFTFRAFDAAGARDGRDLAARDVADGVLIVDDPGVLQQPKHSVATIHVYGGRKPPENGIMSIQIEGDLIARHRFFSAVLGKPVGGVDASPAAPAVAMSFEPRKEPTHDMTGVSLRAGLIDAVGAERAAGARFSRMSGSGGRGSFYGIMLDGKRQIVVRVTDPPGQQHYEFFWEGPDGRTAVGTVMKFEEKDAPSELQGRPYHLIGIGEAGDAERLLVFRRGERGAPIAGLWPLLEWLEILSPMMEADPKARADAGVDMELVRREARSDRWMARCERFLSAYPSFEVKTSSDEWRRAACARGATEPRR